MKFFFQILFCDSKKGRIFALAFSGKTPVDKSNSSEKQENIELF
jgi:hypothetical protein